MYVWREIQLFVFGNIVVLFLMWGFFFVLIYLFKLLLFCCTYFISVGPNSSDTILLLLAELLSDYI